MIRLILIFTFLIVNLSQLSLAKIASVIGNPKTEEIYFEVNKDTRNYPASLTKIMTLFIIFDEINLTEPSLIKPGNKVSFYQISKEEYLLPPV